MVDTQRLWIGGKSFVKIKDVNSGITKMKTIYINKRQATPTSENDPDVYVSYQKRQRRNKWMRKLHHNLNNKKSEYDHWSR